MDLSARATRPRPTVGLALLAVLLAPSCGREPLGPEDVLPQPDAPFQTSALQYTLADDGYAYHIIIPTSYLNRSSTTVYAWPCGWALDKKTGSSWSVAFTPVCPSIGVPPKSYAPGVPYVVDFSVSGAYAPNTFPRFANTPTPGVYRFRVELYARANYSFGGIPTLEDPLSLAGRISNEFWLGLPYPARSARLPPVG